MPKSLDSREHLEEVGVPETLPTVEIPKEVKERLDAWQRLFMQSTAWHKFLGVTGVAASTLAAIDFGEKYALAPRLLAALAAVCLAVLGFWQLDRRYQKFVRAWRTLDPVAMKFAYGKATLDELFKAVERGEAIITDFEQELVAHRPAADNEA